MDTDAVRFWLNGRPVHARAVCGTTTLLRYLRDHAGLSGTKEGCGEGDCGACTVVVLEDRPGSEPTWRAVDACLLFLPMLQGKRVFTVEGLARSGGALHPVQRALVEHRASQCGYCTPGFVMSLAEACHRDDIDGADAIDDQLCGNLCRCTGYRPIRDAARQVAGTHPHDALEADALAHAPEPAALTMVAEDALGRAQRYLQPPSLSALFQARAAWPDAILVAGGTDVALEITKRHRHLPVVIGLEAIEVLRRLEADAQGWTVGACVTLTRLGEELGPALPPLQRLLRVFGSRQIRSRATIGGNLCNASPIGDLAPLLVALGATALVAGPEGERALPLEDFLVGYRRTALEGAEILRAVRIPRPVGLVGAYKVSRRRELDISTVAAGMRARVQDGYVQEIVLSFGGMAARPGARARHAEAALRGAPWTLDAVEAAAARLVDDFQPIDDLRGSARYRALLARNLLVGFLLETTNATGALPIGAVALEAR